MNKTLFPLAVLSALLLSLPARADGEAEGAAAKVAQKTKEKEPVAASPDKLPFPVSIQAPAELAALLREHLSIINRQTEPDADIDQEQMQFLAEEAPDEIKQIVRSQGYFRADIQVAPHGRGWRITVKPGPRTRVGDVEVSIVGKVLEDSELATYYKRAMANWALPVGQPFVNSEWSGSKDSVLSAVRRYKYPLASLTESRATINPQTSQAVLSVNVDSKQPVYFGDIQVSGNERYPASVVTGMAQFKPGDPYDFDKILDYQQALEQNSHYSRAQVEADFSKMVDDRVPLLVSVSEVPRQKFDIGLRYDSKDGPGIRLGYEHYNVFNRGYVFAAATDLAGYQKASSIGLSQPRNSNGWYWTGSIAHDRSTTQKLVKNSLSSGIWRVRDRGGIEARFGLEYVSESRRITNGPDLGHSNVLMPTASWRRQNIETLLRPANGYYLEGKVGATLGSLGSSAAVQRVHGRAGYYFTPEEHKNIGTFVVRGELGYTHSDQDLEVPSVLLFRSGGANSVRGYEQDSIGRKGPNNSVLPDRALAVASFEYQKPIGKNFALALFHDMGSVSHNFTNMNWHHGSGVGLRWFSPIAPFSFDLAYGHQDRKLRWHISLGTRF